jgi:hypothetical protein
MSELFDACGSMVTLGSSLTLLRLPKRSVPVKSLLPKATAPFFSVKLFELAA